jgi:hypothetical protein
MSPSCLPQLLTLLRLLVGTWQVFYNRPCGDGSKGAALQLCDVVAATLTARTNPHAGGGGGGSQCGERAEAVEQLAEAVVQVGVCELSFGGNIDARALRCCFLLQETDSFSSLFHR